MRSPKVLVVHPAAFIVEATSFALRTEAHVANESKPNQNMFDAQVFRIKDYELTCSARAGDNGHFMPQLVVSKQIWPSRPRTIALRRGSYPTAEVAIQSAHTQGVEWVRDFGK